MQDEIIRLTRAQVREIDRIAIEEYHIPGIVLMENAARGAADVAINMLRGVARPHVMIFCGTGNNGGDGYAIARHLHNRRFDVEIICLDRTAADDAILNGRIAEAMAVKISTLNDGEISSSRFPDLLIDAMFGTGLTRPLTGNAIRAIEFFAKAKDRGVPILSIDIPSGLDCDSGEPLGDCIRASKTVTFVAEKAGFANPKSRDYTGEIIVVDIGAPVELIQRVRQKINSQDHSAD